MSHSQILYLNNVDASTYGFFLVDSPELLAMGGHTYQTMPVVQRQGVILGTARPTVEPRTLRLSGYISGTSLADARAKLDTLSAAIGTRPCRIRTAWATDREWYGVLTAMPAGPNAAYWQQYLAAELEFLLYDPYAYATTQSIVPFTSAAVPVPLGTASSRGHRDTAAIIRITGAATTPVLTYSNSAGVTVATMNFSGYSPLANDYIEIDLARGLVEKVVSGARSNAMGNLASGWSFPALDPADGNVLFSAWPTLAVSTGTGQVRYHRAWR